MSNIDWTKMETPEVRLEKVKESKISQIKNLRDHLKMNGGYPTHEKWFHSDTFSRSQQLGLVLLGQNIPVGLMWKTMDGSFIEMTPTLAQSIFQAAAIQDTAIFAYAEQLSQQVITSTSLSSVELIDITQGWPATYSPANETPS